MGSTEVFLSFRGDTRKGFTDNLYETLRDYDVKVFIDEKSLERGENITDNLRQAIRGSKMAVIIFSRRYAESRWCLEELVEIMDCKKKLGQVVLPIFYDIEPSDVRNQRGSFEKAFRKHEEERFHQVQPWREALTEAAKLAGKAFKSRVGYEGKFIREIVRIIRDKLHNTYLKVATYEVGIGSRVKDISDDLQVGISDEVRIIGIWGMVGAGKTTVAKAILNRFHQKFDGKSFLQVRENGMVKLQNQLLKDILRPAKIEVSSIAEGTKIIEDSLGNRRLLLIVDDVDRMEQLDELAIKRSSFGPGSRIIITTRNKHLLNKPRVDKTCLARTMNEKEALELLSLHAFSEKTPHAEYLELSREVVGYCGGLPLALQLLGSDLSTKSTSEWRDALDKFKRLPHCDIHEKLKVSYDGLTDYDAKAIFLDISCFFIGMNKDHAMSIFDGCGLRPQLGIGKLLEQCLVAVDNKDNLIMHNLIRDMGRCIVHAESPWKPEERSRLWHHEDIKCILRKEYGTNKIEGLALEFPEDDSASYSTKAFEKMEGLRFLKIKGVKFTGHCKPLSRELRWLCWHKFPLNIIPEDFNQSNLIDVDLSDSNIEVWQNSDVYSLEKLKYLNLGNCKCLKQSPDFSKLLNLQELILQNCNLTDDAMPKHFGGLSSLEVFDLSGNDFSGIPTLSGLSKLRTLQLANCRNLQAIPDLPTNLEILEANECIALERMPDFSEMSRMSELHLNHCPKLTEIPGLHKSLNRMKSIHMEGCIKLTAAFKEEILKEWRASRKDLEDVVVPHLSEYIDDRTHDADDLCENGSHKRLRSKYAEETDAREKRNKFLGDQEDTTALKIRSFPSAEFYSESLEDGPDIQMQTARSWHGYSCFGPFCFFDLHEGKQSKPSGSGSWVNVDEVEFVMLLYHNLVDKYPELKSSQQFAIISPYAAQVNLLKERFRSTFGVESEKVVDITTVDGSQGREKDVAIFSCVRASKDGGIGFLGAFRRMNVGITRAKFSVLVVGSASTLRKGDEHWNNLIQSAEKRDRLLKVSKPYASFFSDENLETMAIKKQRSSIEEAKNVVDNRFFQFWGC